MVVSFPCANMASFDDSGKSGAAFCYVLEAGDYPIYAGTDVRSCEQIGVHTETELRVTERLASRADCAPKETFDRLVAATDEQGKIEKAYESVPLSTVSRREEIEKNLPEAPDFTGDKGIKLEDVANNRATLAGFTAQLKDVELEALCRGDYVMNSKLGTPGNAAVYGGILKSLRKKACRPSAQRTAPPASDSIAMPRSCLSARCSRAHGISSSSASCMLSRVPRWRARAPMFCSPRA